MSDQSSGRASADRGLAGLGLVMQLFGTIFASLMGMMVFSFLLLMGRARGGAGELFLYVLLIGGTGLARSIVHRNAGADLCYAVQQPFAGIRRYFMMSVANTAAILFVVVIKAHMPVSVWVPLTTMMMAWPTALLVMTKMPAFASIDSQRVPVLADKGFEGASLIMLALGLMGVAFGAIATYLAFKGMSMRGAPGWFVLILVSAVMLLIRSVLHVQAALRGVRETAMDRVVEGANRYANFGVIASFVAGGSLFLIMIAAGGLADPSVMIYLAAFVWMLLAWPLAIRRFFSERQFADMMAGNDPTAHVRAPDMGMSSLGWLLFAQALLPLASTLPALLMGSGSLFGGMGEGGGMRGMGGMGEFARAFQLFQPQTGASPWWTIGLAAVEMWAAIELIRMGELHKIAATAFGAIATAITLYQFWPVISHMGMLMREGMAEFVFLIGALAIQLAIPLTTLFAANRNPLASATARYVPPAPPPGQPLG